MPSKKNVIYNCLDCNKEVLTRARKRTNVCKSCNAKRNCVKIREKGIKPNQLRPFEYVYNSLMRNATKMKRKVSFTYEEFLDFTTIKSCHYCESIIPWTQYILPGKKNTNYFLDRKDNNIDYVMDNLVVCCPKCNKIKSNEFTYDEFIKVARFVKEMRSPNEISLH